MKISIVINNYNYERFLAEAIDSALAQKNRSFDRLKPSARNGCNLKSWK